MRLVRALLVITASSAALAAASAASAQTDRYAYGPSTPNSDGTEGYGSYSAMEGSSFLDMRRTVDHHNDGLTYPLGQAQPQRSAPAYAYAPDAERLRGPTSGSMPQTSDQRANGPR